MAMSEFLRNVQTARNVALFNQAAHYGSNPPTSGPNYTSLSRAIGVWLSPHVVAGYDPGDFGFLPAEAQSALRTAVGGYRDVLAAIVDREPSDDEMGRALDALSAIAAALGDGLLDTEGRALLKAVYAANGEQPFPEFVLGVDYTLDADWMGDPGIWIWVIVPDELDPDTGDFRQFATRFPKIVSGALMRAGSDRLPYVHYRLLSEATGLNSEVAA